MFKIAVGIVVLVLLAVGAAVTLRLRAGRDTSATQPTTAKAPGKVAIVYYSQSKVRNTALIAKWIQKHLGGDLIEIETVEPYPEPYTLTLAAAEKERRSGQKRSVKPVPSLAAYDVVFLGTPIWYGVPEVQSAGGKDGCAVQHAWRGRRAAFRAGRQGGMPWSEGAGRFHGARLQPDRAAAEGGRDGPPYGG